MKKQKGIDLTGQRFGKLVVIRRADERRRGNPSYIWECRCDCGNTAYPAASNLRGHKVKSCGCLRRSQQSYFSRDSVQQYVDRLRKFNSHQNIPVKELDPKDYKGIYKLEQPEQGLLEAKKYLYSVGAY